MQHPCSVRWKKNHAFFPEFQWVISSLQFFVYLFLYILSCFHSSVLLLFDLFIFVAYFKSEVVTGAPPKKLVLSSKSAQFLFFHQLFRNSCFVMSNPGQTFAAYLQSLYAQNIFSVAARFQFQLL